ncbi:glucosaminidase domain-containing protein [Bacillus gobiensis]|uniref:glucosaminidase domain-containing protein n=1 Tax=Bacillus gobiensis TaxID=1441095 RepID=UPI003D1FEACE
MKILLPLIVNIAVIVILLLIDQLSTVNDIKKDRDEAQEQFNELLKENNTNGVTQDENTVLPLTNVVALLAESEQENNKGGIATCSIDENIEEDLWNKQFSRAGVLSEKSDVFIEVANQHDIDPVLFAAIAFHETAWGKSRAVVEKNNPGGLMGSNGLMSFPTLEDGIESMGQTLHNRIIGDGLTTIKDLGGVYAPVGADNDPNNLNKNWVPTITDLTKKLGGLTMKCKENAIGDIVTTAA